MSLFSKSYSSFKTIIVLTVPYSEHFFLLSFQKYNMCLILLNLRYEKNK